MRLTVTAADALRGQAQKRWEARRTAFQRASHAGVKETANKTKDRLRADVRAAGMGNKLANTWRSQTFPERGFSADAAGVVWSRAPQIIDSFVTGDRLRSPDDLFMAVPTENAPKNLPRKNRVLAVERRVGPLKFVLLPGGGRSGVRGMLVAENLQKSKGKRGGFRKASAATLRRGTQETAAMFWLVPFVSMPKKLRDPKQVARREGLLLGRRVARQMQTLQRRA